MLEKTSNKKLSEFLDRFGSALASRDIEAAASLFQDDCYWRDLVTFTWNIRTLEGKDEIRDMLTEPARRRPSRRAGRSPKARMPSRPTACSKAGSVSRPRWRAASAI